MTRGFLSESIEDDLDDATEAALGILGERRALRDATARWVVWW